MMARGGLKARETAHLNHNLAQCSNFSFRNKVQEPNGIATTDNCHTSEHDRKAVEDTAVRPLQNDREDAKTARTIHMNHDVQVSFRNTVSEPQGIATSSNYTAKYDEKVATCMNRFSCDFKERHSGGRKEAIPSGGAFAARNLAWASRTTRTAASKPPALEAAQSCPPSSLGSLACESSAQSLKPPVLEASKSCPVSRPSVDMAFALEMSKNSMSQSERDLQTAIQLSRSSNAFHASNVSQAGMTQEEKDLHMAILLNQQTNFEYSPSVINCNNSTRTQSEQDLLLVLELTKNSNIVQDATHSEKDLAEALRLSAKEEDNYDAVTNRHSNSNGRRKQQIMEKQELDMSEFTEDGEDLGGHGGPIAMTQSEEDLATALRLSEIEGQANPLDSLTYPPYKTQSQADLELALRLSENQH